LIDIFDTAAVRASGMLPDGPLAAVLSGRDDILTMTQQAHDVALMPNEPGGLSHKERAALSCRMAKLSQEKALAAHFLALIANASGSSEAERLADPSFDGGPDSRLRAILRHTDLVTSNPKAVVAGDIPALTTAGVSENDIVRLSELVAFVSYQIRLTIGLRLMGEAS
jgi:uncharacterized protein YciW